MGSREPKSKLRTVVLQGVGAPHGTSMTALVCVDSVEEICAWLGTYRERLRVVRNQEQPPSAVLAEGPEARNVAGSARIV